jgi:hypothetical protein
MSIAAQKAAYEESLPGGDVAGLRAQRLWYTKLSALAVAKPLGTICLGIIVGMGDSHLRATSRAVRLEPDPC